MILKKHIRKNDLPPSVVIGAGSNGLHIIRSFGRRGISVINLISSYSSDYSIKSKYSLKVYTKDLRGERLIERLIDLSEDIGEKAVLFCTSDLDVLAVSLNKEKLDNYYYIILPPYNVAETLMNKKLFYGFAVSNKLTVPNTYFTNSQAEVENISRNIFYPCIVKPEYHDEYWDSNILSRYGIKVFYVHDKNEFDAIIKRFRIENRPLVIQEWIEGNDTDVFFCLTYIDHSHQPLAVFTGRKIRQYPPLTGSTSLAESIWDPNVAEESLKLLRTAGCLGICSVEFKRCARSQKLYITEPTVGRVDTQEGISISAGMDIPFLCYLDAIGKKPGPVEYFREGIKWINEPFDLYSIKEYLSNGSISLINLLSSYQGSRSYCLWALDDLKPFLAFFVDVFKKAGRKMFRKIHPTKGLKIF